MDYIKDKLLRFIPEKNIRKNEPMAKHTSFKIGGPADLFIMIENIAELEKVLEVAKEENIEVTCIGNGSNLLVKDNGIRGIVIKLNFKDVSLENEKITVGAGVQLSKIARIALENSLSGLEFAYGIPGTVGGAIKMNAGAYGGEFKDIVLETTYIDKNLEFHTVNNKNHEFSYRHSKFSDTDDIIISTILKLKKENIDNIKKKMEENLLKRKEKQPIDLPNAGSIFKRKNEFIPAEIIDKCNLKGYNIGNAYVSEKHAGFIVNKGNATAQDVLSLIEYIKKVVKEKYKIDLELEIKVVGE